MDPQPPPMPLHPPGSQPFEPGPIGGPVPVDPAQRPRAEPLRVPPPPWPPAAGLFIVQTGYHWTAGWMWSRPYLALDGHVTRVGWGQNSYVVPPGSHHVLLAPHGPRRRAKEVVVHVRPGQQTVVHYAAPLLRFDPCVVGPTPQRSPDVAGYLTILAVVLLLFVAVVVTGLLLLG